MIYYDAKEAVKEMRKHGFDIVRCEDCKYSRSYGDRLYCHNWEAYMKSGFFCGNGIHIEKTACYECKVAEECNLEDDDSPCRECAAV
jgi:hypothetical protein